MATFREKVRDPRCPVIIYELIPPASDCLEGSTKAYAQSAVELVFDCHLRVDAFNIPEIRSEEREGGRTYQFFCKIEPREFGRELQHFIHGDTEIITNHSSVYDPEDFQIEWLKDSKEKYNQTNVILIGGESRKIKYPGPSIEQMLKLIHAHYPDTFFCGGIVISTRRYQPGDGIDEPDRLIQKSQAGIEYFTSQILYEPDYMQTLLLDYQKACDDAAVKPQRIFFSFAPVTTKKDIKFLRWLGVVIPEDVEARITTADIGVGWRSIKVMCEVLTDILEFHDKHQLTIPIGLNIEHITHRNFEITKELIDRLGNIYYLYMK